MQKWPPPSSFDPKNPSHHPLFSPTPDELRALVLDYLCHNAFINTARAFVRDSAVKHLDRDGDEIMSHSDEFNVDRLAQALDERLAVAEVRRGIRTHILSGRMDEAKILLNKHFPFVLSEEREPLLDAEEPSPTTKFRYPPPTSVEPTHLSLNLRIHAFIEAARTAPLPYRPASPSSCSPSPPPLSLPITPVPAHPAKDGNGLSVQQHKLLHRAQTLYSEAHCLVKPEDRATYLFELSQVSGLLAYADPENSPMAPYLTQEKREGIADQIESAILYRTSRSPVSRVELYIRYTTTIWDLCHEWDMKLPPPSRWPPGIGPPTNRKAQLVHNTDYSSKKGDKATTELAYIPRFDLSGLLDPKS